MTSEFNEIELRKLDLNLLLVFSALVRERSVRNAATRLYLGPSAVSMSLTRLRDQMGDRLFVKTRAGMEPTPRAQALWAQLEPALGSIEAAIRGVKGFDPATAERIIRFATPDDLEFVLVPRLMERLDREAPGIRLVLRPSDFRTLLARIDEGDADLALSATPTRGIERRHRVRALHRDRFVVLFDQAQVGLAAPLDLDTYLSVPHLLLSIAGDLHGPMDERLEAIGRRRTVAAAFSHFPTMPFVLKTRRCLMNMPSVAAHYFAAHYGLAVCETPIPSPQFEVSLIWHARTDTDAALVWFRHLVEKVLAEIVAEAGHGSSKAST